MSVNPTLLSIQSIFKDTQYSIPIYQREYAWGITEISQLLSDICSQVKSDRTNKETLNYYLGTLVIHTNGKREDVIDGQQRLTTLYILLSRLSHSNDSSYQLDFNFQTLSFDSRPNSIHSLKNIHGNQKSKNSEVPLANELSILAAYNIIAKELPLQCAEFDISVQEFTDYLLKSTKLLKTIVPPDTDLNHYFEIMNVRGEQLEKHEVLKSRLMSELKLDKDRQLFATVWNAASNMNKYIQLAFKRDITSDDVNIRKKIFGADGNRIPSSYDELKSCFSLNTKNNDEVKSNTNKDDPKEDENTLAFIISQPIKQSNKVSQEQQDDLNELTAVINFPNFLLHVLKIMEGNLKDQKINSRIALDDKQLLQQFKKYIDTHYAFAKADFSKEFCYQLFKAKFLFDNYIIRNLDLGHTTEWVLRRQIHQFEKGKSYHPKNTFEIDNESKKDETINDQSHIIMLQSMFHVSFPTRIYKHWFNGAMRFLMNNSKKGIIKSTDFIDALKMMNDAFFFDRNQVADSMLDYDTIIYSNNCKRKNDAVDGSIWLAGTATKNFTFNRLEYLLWYFTKEKNGSYSFPILENLVSSFSFGFRSSVEHFYPQQPRNGEPANYEIDRFGNLCLLSQQQNSRFSNDLPSAKKANYYKPDDKVESLKMSLMWDKADQWFEEGVIKKHEEKMIEILSTKHEWTES